MCFTRFPENQKDIFITNILNLLEVSIGSWGLGEILTPERSQIAQISLGGNYFRIVANFVFRSAMTVSLSNSHEAENPVMK